jgi:hypothetical protein
MKAWDSKKIKICVKESTIINPVVLTRVLKWDMGVRVNQLVDEVVKDYSLQKMEI